MTEKNDDQILLLGFREGGGFVLRIEKDRVSILRIYPGMDEHAPLEVIGTVNREHIALVAANLTKIVGLPLFEF